MRKITKLFLIIDLVIIMLFASLYFPFTNKTIISSLTSNQTGKEIADVIYGKKVVADTLSKTVFNSLSDNKDYSNFYEENKNEKRITLLMTGDGLIHSNIFNSHKTKDGYDFYDCFTDVKPIIQQYDLAYYNQESILGGSELGITNYPQFNSPYEAGDAFVDCGFNLVSLANNHTLDGKFRYGMKGVENNRAYWNKQYEENGIIATGSWTSWEERNQIVIGECKGITYGLLSYTTCTNMLEPFEGQEYCTNKWDPDVAKKDIEMYRDKVDVLMVAMHWGVMYVFEPNSQQKKIAQYLADLDVDIVIGCHAHYIQPIEMIDDTLILYGVGNFLSGQDTDTRLTGALFTLDIVKEERNDSFDIKFENMEAELIYTAKRRRSHIYPFSMLNTSIFPGYKEMYKTIDEVIHAKSDICTTKPLN